MAGSAAWWVASATAPYSHVVRYRRPTAAFAGNVDTLLDAPSDGIRWGLIVPSGARQAQ